VTGENPAWFRGGDLPVERVSWHDVAGFCLRCELSLPTEAQWEYACRAGTTTAYSFGDDVREFVHYANFSDRNDPSANGPQMPDLDDGFGPTAPVGSYRPNAWGLHDMHGNAMEFCRDTRGIYSAGPVTDPLYEAATTSTYIVRGGAWFTHPWAGRSAARFWHHAGQPSDICSVRLVSPLAAAQED
jgi:formylglycine-generating enzyme required for sulfatase activity